MDLGKDEYGCLARMIEKSNREYVYLKPPFTLLKEKK